MCGIVGGMALDGTWRALRSAISQMADSLAHRGPDDSGLWCDENAAVTLAHRRLAILDLTQAGRQPMVSASGRFVTVFNGEIYNHLEIRKELARCGGPHTGNDADSQWRGHSDTETMLAAMEEWGIAGSLKKAVGMFAIAVWDRETRTLTVARDRLGEKPVYYGWVGGVFVFASELKALRLCPGFRSEIDRGALTLLLKYSYVPSPLSIYRGVRKLPAGSYIELKLDGVSCQSREMPEPTAYWSVSQAIEQGVRDPFHGSEKEAVLELERLLIQTIDGQMVADVPLGAMLSGGLDSSMVVSLMQSQSSRPVRTFTIGFHEAGYNEAVYAKAVARQLGTTHTELYVTPKQAMDVIPRLPRIYDEPFSDASQIPTYLVAELARSQVTVALTGDAGDELFGGYNRYFLTDAWWGKLERVPRSARSLIARSIAAVAPRHWDRLGSAMGWLLPKAYQSTTFGDKLHKLAGVLEAQNPDAFYRLLLQHWPQAEEVVIGSERLPTNLDTASAAGPIGVIPRMMHLDQVSYLPDDILVKLDRAGMAVSLETRVPFLDHRVVEFSWSLPLSMKVQNGQGKRILRQLLDKYVPRTLVDRPKMGFGVPIDSWLRGPLRGWAESLLNESRLRLEGYFHPKLIREKWREHQSGSRNWQYPLWDVLMFQAWLEAQNHAAE